MQPIATDEVAWSVCLSVCMLVTFVSPAKTAELIEMPFGWMTRVIQEITYYMGSRYPKQDGRSRGLFNPLKSTVGHLCGVRSKKSTAASARLLQLTALFSTMPHFSNAKNPRATLPLVVLDHLFKLRQTNLSPICRAAAVGRRWVRWMTSLTY